MSEWEMNAEDVINYSPNGDNIDTFAQKVKRNLERIFILLNALNESNVAMSHEQVLAANNATVNHLKRLIGELHLALAIANLETTGYDSLQTKVDFEINGYSTTAEGDIVNVTSAVRGSDTINVNSIKGLIIGGNYKLKSGGEVQGVKIKRISSANGTNYVTVSNAVQFAPGSDVTLIRNYVNVTENKVKVEEECYLATEPFVFINKETGASKSIMSAHLNVKHQNVKDAEITAEIALINNVRFVNGEVIGIGSGANQQVTLSNTNKIQNWGFKIYFNGVEQTEGYTFSASEGFVTFNAPSGTVVTADYYYNWGEENFRPMTNNGIYVDYKNPQRATTQFSYYGADMSNIGNVAIIKITLKRGTGAVSNERLGVATGALQGFKMPHHAIESSIRITPSSTTWLWNDSLEVLTLTASAQQNISASYNYQGQSYYVDSFVVMFHE